MHLSEDDIRTKVVYEWLKGCGVSANELAIERTINLRLGKGVRELHSRADILIKNNQGLNLLIIEVKNPDHQFSVDDEKQAISYARAVDGNIAPFTILTNGHVSIIYNTISGEQLNTNYVPPDHPHIKNNFVPNTDGIKVRMEALEFLISFSEENLLAFCKGQIDFRMKYLKGADLFGGKKYIPELYVERSETKEALKQKLFKDNEEKRNLILVIGPPQHGKTCFMCHSAESFLSEGNPTLFYPAIGLTSGLIPSMKEDLEWCFGEHMESVQWIKRLNSIGERLNKRIFIFIDGWNEMTEKALKINHECQRLELNHIAIVLSTTSPSLKRLLIDEAGNPTYIAESVDLTFPQIDKLLTEPLRETERLGIVQIGKFNHYESIKAKEIYARSYKVSFQTNDLLLADPFYLRLASELFSEKVVPKSITRTELIKNSLVLKGKRRNINEVVLYDSLVDLAQVFYLYDRPTSILNFPKCFRDEEKLIPWQESAILILFNVDSLPLLDFYYSHDLDFAVAVLHKNWRKAFSTSDTSKILEELNDCIETEVGQSALRWFLSNPENCDLIQSMFQAVNFESCFDLPIGKILSECIVKQVVLNDKIEFQWLEHHLDKLIALAMNENAHVSELAELLFSLIMSLDRETERDSYQFWMQHLVKHDTSIEEIGLQESYVFQIYSPDGEELRSYDGYGYDFDVPFDTELFEEFLFNEDCIIAKRASLFLAYTCPYHYLELLPSLFKKQYKGRVDTFLDIINDPCCGIIHELHDRYFGEMCPGWLDNTEKGSEEIINEYDTQIRLWSPLFRVIKPDSELYNSVTNIIEVLKEYALLGEDKEMPINDPNQLKLDF